MKNKVIVLVMGLLLLMVSGCRGGDSGDTGSTTTTGAQGEAFIGGEIGLEALFLAGAPPDEVYDDSFDFDINVKLENKGEYNVPTNSVNVTIVGIDPGDFGKSKEDLTKKVTEIMTGARRDAEGNEIIGTITNVEFPSLRYSRKATGNPKFIIRADVCYPYGTVAISQLCVLKDLLGTTRKAGETPFCKPTENSLPVENSGAPLHISSFDQSVIGKDKISFTFNIEHKGNKDSRVAERNTECDISLNKKDIVYVNVTTDTGADEDLICSGLKNYEHNAGTVAGDIKLFGERGGAEERSIYCTQKLDTSRGDFNKQVKITLEYDYKEHIEKDLLVKHVETS